MAIAIIDEHEIEIPDDRRINGIEAARLAGIEIPYFCWHPGLSVRGSCRMCLIEFGTRNAESGEIAMLPKLVPACNTLVTDGTVLVTNSEKVQRARAMVEERLLLQHPIDCPICDKAGECELQDYHFQYGQDERRADVRPFTSRRIDIGDVTHFTDRCILCSRCVRFTREITGTGELMITHRGADEEVAVLSGFPLNNNLSGNVVDLCPVGALGDKDFLYRQRVWFLRQHPAICTGCATGCSIWVEENHDRIHRIKPRENPSVNQWWICNHGRYRYPHVHDPRRLSGPRRRDGQSVVELDWAALIGELGDRLREAGRLAAVISPNLTVEEAYLLCKFIREIDKDAILALGPVPTVGQDERFPNEFTISAERCPNRLGVEAVIAHFAGRVTPWDDLVRDLHKGDVRGVWVSGGYTSDWIDEATAGRFESVELLVVQDLFPSPLSQRAGYALPAAAFAERDGSYVNRDDRLQSAPWAIRPPMGVRTEASLFWELVGMKGLYDARSVLNEVAQEIPYFSAAAAGAPETGIDLKANQPAHADVPGKSES